MIAIGIVDEHPIVCIGLSHLITKNLADVSISSVSRLANFETDKVLHLIILGSNKSSRNVPLSQIKECKSLYPSVPIMVFGHTSTNEATIKYLQAGVRGCISKESSAKELITGLKLLLKGEYFIETEPKNKLSKERNAGLTKQDKSLTNKQYIIANYLCQGMKNSEISEKIKLKPSTVSTFKSTIFRKMNVTNIIELNKAIRMGIPLG